MNGKQARHISCLINGGKYANETSWASSWHGWGTSTQLAAKWTKMKTDLHYKSSTHLHIWAVEGAAEMKVSPSRHVGSTIKQLQHTRSQNTIVNFPPFSPLRKPREATRPTTKWPITLDQHWIFISHAINPSRPAARTHNQKLTLVTSQLVFSFKFRLWNEH